MIKLDRTYGVVTTSGKPGVGTGAAATPAQADDGALKGQSADPCLPYADDGETPDFWRSNLDYGERSANKVAFIRGENMCPFGLPIPEACHCAGNSVKMMLPVKDGEYEKSNQAIYDRKQNGNKCPYADKILDNFNKVDCDFGDVGEGKQSINFTGSPIYPTTFTGVGTDLIDGYPFGYYADNNETRNVPYGLYSLQGSFDKHELIKIAKYFDRVGNKYRHASILEHVTYNFSIEGISRACLQELARHRMASLSVKSTRYTLKELKDTNQALQDSRKVLGALYKED
jgi:hypothetical protein